MGRRMRAVLVVVGLLVGAWGPGRAAASPVPAAVAAPPAVVEAGDPSHADGQISLAPPSDVKMPELPPRHWRPAGGVDTPMTGGTQPAGSHVAHYAAQADPAPALQPLSEPKLASATEPAQTESGSLAGVPQTAAAAAMSGPNISGRVTDEDGNPLDNILVGAYGSISSTSTHTGADGTYSLTVAPGSWTVWYTDESKAHSRGYHADSGFVYRYEDANPVVVGSDDVTNIDAVLPPPLHIGGKVVGADHPSGVDYSRIRVTVYFYGASYDATVASDGTWTASWLTPGPYTIEFEDTEGVYGHVWYATSGCTWDQAAATIVTLGTSDVVVPDAELPFWSYISGTVVNANGTPLSGIWVSSTPAEAGGGTTDSDGKYRLWVRPGTYTVGFYDPNWGYEQAWYRPDGLTTTQAQASPITVAAESTVSIDATMSRRNGNHITGVITDSRGDPVAGLVVRLWWGDSLRSGDSTNANGEYWLLAEASANYQVEVIGNGTYSHGWYSSLGFVYTQKDATFLPYEGKTLGHNNLVVPFLHNISGTVTDSVGAAISGVEVSAFDNSGYFAKVTTASDGTYSIGVPPGRYTVGFHQPSEAHASGWYGLSGFTCDPGEASTLTVSESDVIGIDVSMPSGRYISGTVRNGSGVALSGVEVEAYIDGSYYGYQVTNYAGQYSIVVGPGTYTVWFIDEYSEYAPGWYSTAGYKVRWSDATPLVVDSANRDGIDVKLPGARHISGKVTGETVAGLTDTEVVAYANGMWVGLGFTPSDWSGNYSVAVPPGSYTLWIYDFNYETFASGWYRSTGFTIDAAAATVVNVSSANATGKNVKLPLAHVLGGRVTDSKSAPLPGIFVSAWVNGHQYNDAYTHPDGRFTIHVAPGGYKVGFFDESATHLSGWYTTTGFNTDSAAATSVVISSADQTAVNVVLPEITAPSAPNAVEAVAYSKSALVSWNPPSSDGHSTITGYTVTSDPGGKHCTTTVKLSCTVTGLTNGTPYTFTVTATNAIGTSDPSIASAPVTPIAVPDAPTAVQGVGFDAAIVVSWAAPADNGSDITGYTATAWLGADGSHSCPTTTELTCTISGLTNSTPYWIGVTATNVNGTGPEGWTETMVAPRIGNSYVPLTPNRILDTRTAKGLPGALIPNTPATFQVTGQVPGDPGRNVPSSATAVTGVLSVANSTAGGYLSLTPDPIAYPTTSTLNFPMGDARATGVTVTLSGAGSLSLTYGGALAGKTADAILDITGYFVPGTGGSTYFALTPNRIVDSRAASKIGITTGPLIAGTHKTFAVTGRAPTDVTKNVPADAVAVTGTLTVTAQTAPGMLSLGPDPLDAPPTASLFFPGLKTDSRATGLTVKLADDGTLSVTFTSSIVGAKTDVVFDVNGYFLDGGSGAMYVPLTPNRLVDSRIKLGLPKAIHPFTAATFAVTGRVPADPSKNVPTGAVAVTGILTVTGQTAPGYLSLTKTPTKSPTTSTLNFPRGDNRATGVTVPLGPGGKLSVTYGASPSTVTTHVVFDVSGYFVN
jgi:hypothetical protein